MNVNGWKFSGLTGGSSTDLDGMDGNNIAEGAFAVVMLDAGTIYYEADLNSGATADGINIVAPVTNAGNIRWIQKPIGWLNALGGVFFHADLTNDPEVLQWVFGKETEIRMGRGDGTSTPIYDVDPTTANFWTYLANFGAVAQVSADDTYVTVADITGSGVLQDVFLPGVTAATNTVYVRLTIDGVEHELSFTATDDEQRFFTAALISRANDPVSVWERGSTGFIGLAAGMTDIALGGEVNLVAPCCRMNHGKSIRFATSLTIEMKATDVSTSNRRDYCGCTYRLDP